MDAVRRYGNEMVECGAEHERAMRSVRVVVGFSCACNGSGRVGAVRRRIRGLGADTVSACDQEVLPRRRRVSARKMQSISYGRKPVLCGTAEMDLTAPGQHVGSHQERGGSIQVVRAGSRSAFRDIATLKTIVFSPELLQPGSEKKRQLMEAHILRLMLRLFNAAEQVVYGAFIPHRIKFVGCAQFRAVTVSYNGSSREVWYMSSVAVHPSTRKRGVARALVSRIIQDAEQAPHAEYITLHVEPDNAAAVRLYESLGFMRLSHSSTQAHAMIAVVAQKLEEADVELAREEFLYLPIKRIDTQPLTLA